MTAGMGRVAADLPKLTNPAAEHFSDSYEEARAAFRSRAKTAPRLLAPMTNMASRTTFASRSRAVPRPLTAPTLKPGGTTLRRLSTSQSLPGPQTAYQPL